jgi:23S rRNA pseudouridine2605 synthase
MRERLQKVVAAAGLASRRGAEAMIGRGEVTVNGRIAQLGDRADPRIDAILVRGKPLGWKQERVYLALNKPAGFVTSLRSTHGERTVLELVDIAERVFPVGRLDKDTSGLLLLTDDGDWANVVTHPRYGVQKEYQALVRGRPDKEALHLLRRGLELPDGSRTSPAQVSVLRAGREETLLALIVNEGKKRQIRSMLESVGHPVLALERVRIGSILLSDLGLGRWRSLTDREVGSVWQHAVERSATRGARA